MPEQAVALLVYLFAFFKINLRIATVVENSVLN
jgi:hypothetical protein